MILEIAVKQETVILIEVLRRISSISVPSSMAVAKDKGFILYADINEPTGVWSVSLTREGKGHVVERTSLCHPYGLTLVNGKITFSDTKAKMVKCIDSNWKIVTLAGCGETGQLYGNLLKSKFKQPTSLACEGSTLYVCDTGDSSLSMIRLASILKVTVTVV